MKKLDKDKITKDFMEFLDNDEDSIENTFLYKIASDAIKNKLYSLDFSNKNFEKGIKSLRNDIKNKNQIIRKLRKQLAEAEKQLNSKKLEVSKELYENYLRDQSPIKLIPGDKFYTIKTNYPLRDCPCCKGTGKITTTEGYSLNCTYKGCRNGKIQDIPQYTYLEHTLVTYYKGWSDYNLKDTEGLAWNFMNIFPTKEAVKEVISIKIVASSN